MEGRGEPSPRWDAHAERGVQTRGNARPGWFNHRDSFPGALDLEGLGSERLTAAVYVHVRSLEPGTSHWAGTCQEQPGPALNPAPSPAPPWWTEAAGRLRQPSRVSQGRSRAARNSSQRASFPRSSEVGPVPGAADRDLPSDRSLQTYLGKMRAFGMAWAPQYDCGPEKGRFGHRSARTQAGGHRDVKAEMG